jgi:YegS/Rv2252/BmrU family lipid kinase
MKSLILIVNPVALGASEKGIRHAADLFRAGGYEVTVRFTVQKGDAEAFAREASRDGLPLVVAAGGDGTVNEVVNGIVGSGTAMALLPMGTTNVLAKELGIPEDAEGAATAVMKGTGHSVSLGQITLDTSPPVTRCFCLMAGIGFDGAAVYGLSHAVKRHSGKSAYILSGLSALLRHSPEPLVFTVDGVTCPGYAAIIGNAAKYGGHFSVTPDASLHRPELFVCIMEGKRRRDILRYVLGVVRGRHLGFSDVRYLKAASLAVEGIAHVQIDGDYLGKTPATITVVPDALKIVY